MGTIKLDPRKFISPPYIECPKCGKKSFGILMICDQHYCRRCRECLHPRRTEPAAIYPLPPLNKKVIYIDQFAISNMMKVLNPDTRAHRKGKLDNFWLRLFDKLYSLCQLQLIICPGSIFHNNESLLSPYFEPLRRMYELLSHGVSFYDHETIKRSQIYEHAKNWITGKAEEELSLDVHSVVRGKINAWQDRLIVSVNMEYGADWIDGLRKARERTHKGLIEVFKRWQSERNKTFYDWFSEEVIAFGIVTLQMYLNYLGTLKEIFSGYVKPTVNDVIPPPSVILIHSIRDAFEEAGVKHSDIWIKTVEYLTSPSLKNVPFIKISSMLYAALARKAAAGRKRPPTQGMANDIEFISVLLPYCDAIFVDKECHSYLKEKPLSDAINYGTKVFSLNNKEEFLEYLDEIEVKASKEHLDKVNEIYGEAWRTPYRTLYRQKE